MLEAIHAHKASKELKRKAEILVKKLKNMKLGSVAKVIEDRMKETLAYTYSPKNTGEDQAKQSLRKNNEVG